jgi:hypothetical protein
MGIPSAAQVLRWPASFQHQDVSVQARELGYSSSTHPLGIAPTPHQGPWQARPPKVAARVVRGDREHFYQRNALEQGRPEIFQMEIPTAPCHRTNVAEHTRMCVVQTGQLVITELPCRVCNMLDRIPVEL